MIYVNTIAINQYDLNTSLNCLRIYFYKEDRPAWGWYRHEKAVSIFVILSAEKVCRLFRYRSGLAARRLPLHKQHTYSANHKYTAISRIYRLLFPPFYFLYCREGILRGL